jgi:hypothetical protein
MPSEQRPSVDLEFSNMTERDEFADQWLELCLTTEQITFHTAAYAIERRLGVPGGVAMRMLREACASGDIRSEQHDPRHEDEPRTETIKPNEWAKDQIDIEWERQRNEAQGPSVFRPVVEPVMVLVDGEDFRHWLNKLAPLEAQPTVGGKQSRIIRLLTEMYPTGVPDRSDCPRQPLKAELLRRDPSLNPLNLKTLQRAIDSYNRQLGNAGKHS